MTTFGKIKNLRYKTTGSSVIIRHFDMNNNGMHVVRGEG